MKLLRLIRLQKITKRLRQLGALQRFRIGIGGLALAMTLGNAGNVRAETLTYKVALKSASEVPPNVSSGSGTADVTYDTQSMKLSWKVSY